MKKLLKIVGVLVVLLIIGLVIVYLCAGMIIRPIVESTASKSLGVTTTLGGADLHAFSGNMVLSELHVSNPKPFEAPEFVGLGNCSVTLVPSSLLGNTVKISDITIDGLTLSLEQRGVDSNVAAIMKNLQAASAGSQTGSSTEGGKKQLDIDRVILTNTKVNVAAGGIPGLKSQGFTVTLDRIEIDKPMDPDGRLPKLANLMGQILGKIAQQAAKDPKLGDALGSVTKLGGNFSKELQGGVQNAAKQAQNALGNLLGGNKNKDK